jgi:hypothetical protein
VLSDAGLCTEHSAHDYEYPAQALAAFIAEVEAKADLWMGLDKLEPTQALIVCHGV